MNKSKLINILLIVLIFASFVLRFAFISRTGHEGDFRSIIGWVSDAHNNFHDFYGKTNSNYGPLYPILTRELIHPINFLSRYTTFDKAGWIVERIVLISFDALLAYSIFKLLMSRVGKTRAYLGALLYLINPIIFAATVFWGQSDNLMVLLMLVAFWFILEKRPLEAYLLACGSLLIKPTLIVMMPFFALVLLFDRKIKQFVLGSLALVIVFYLLGTIFFGGSPVTVFKYYVDSLLLNNLIPHMAVGARSLWFWLGETTSDSSKVLFISAHLWGSILLLGANCFGAWIYLRRKDLLALTLAYLIILFGFYFLPTRSHERYQLFSFLPLIILMFTQKRWRPAFVFYILSTITFGYTILAMVPFFKAEYFDSLLRNIRISNTVVGVNLFLMIAAIVFAWYYPKKQYGKLKKDI